jgi:rSAM/selenodomain-associated transferase 2
MSTEKQIRITVIIPTLNESEQIGNLIKHLLDTHQEGLVEIIVSDAASKDDTAKIAATYGVKVLQTKKASRAHQMNEAARLAKGDILYFVHADVLPPSTYFQDILKYRDQGYEFGCYRFKFDSRNPLLAVNSFFTRFKVLWCRGGDQTLFIKKELFQKQGGFNEAYIVMEDFDLIKRLWKDHDFIVMPKSTLVSARKYDNNSYWQVNMANLKLFRLFMKGEKPEILQNMYYKLIKHPKDI